MIGHPSVPLVTTPAVLLRSYPFSETSLILRFYTETLGVVGTMARGVRKLGGKHGGGPSTFSHGLLALYHRDHRDLQTLRDFAVANQRRGLADHPLRLAGASVLAELVLQHAEGEGNPALFHCLSRGLDRVESEPLDLLIPGVLMELWSLVQILGYAPILEHCVQCGRAPAGEDLLRFDYAAGGLRCAACPAEIQGPRLGPRARQQLSELLGRCLNGPLLRPRAHLRLAGDFITYHISGGTPLRSLEVLHALLPKTHA